MYKLNVTADARRMARLGLYNLSVFIFGCALVKVAYGNYKYSHHLKGWDYRLSVACSALIGAIGVYALGKWLVNKELEVK